MIGIFDIFFVDSARWICYAEIGIQRMIPGEKPNRKVRTIS